MMPIEGDFLVNHAIRLAPSALLAATILAGPAFAQAPAKATPPAANPSAAKPAVAAAPAKPALARRALVSTSPNPTFDEGTIQRQLLVLENQGANHFFGEPALELKDLMRTDKDGRGFINILVADGEAAFQDVPHFHVHVIPRNPGDGFGLTFPPGYEDMPPRPELDAVAATVRTALG